jgi:hypothetical protein
MEIGLLVAGLVALGWFVLRPQPAGAPSEPAGAPAPGPKSIDDIIRESAAVHGQEFALMKAIARKESSFNPSAVNLSDPSYGLFQIQDFWLPHAGYPQDKNLLLDPVVAADVAGWILGYFQKRVNPHTGRTFTFPAEVDIYNVGETLWRNGVRNITYRDDVTRFYREYGGLR